MILHCFLFKVLPASAQRETPEWDAGERLPATKPKEPSMNTKHLLKILSIVALVMAVLLPSLLIPGPGEAAQVIRFGFLAKRGKAKIREKWGPMVKALEEKTGVSFELVPLSFDEIEPAIKEKSVDFLHVNPVIFVDQQEKYGVSPLVTKVNLRMGRALTKFAGVIFVRADSPIRTIGDIRGKTFMCAKKTSFGGGQMAFRYLIEHGINPFTETKLLEGRSHDNVVLAVQTGMVDAGTVRSDTLERMEEEGKIKLRDFRVIDKAKDDFPFVHTTRLYPEMLVITLPHVPEATRTLVKNGLLSFKQNDPALQKARIAGWTEPLNYSPVAKTLIINLLNGLNQ